MLLPLYLRHEPTTDKHAPERFDVVAYRDAQLSRLAFRYPWYYSKSKPRRNCRTVMFNCYLWRAVWLPSLTETSQPTA